ncbi:uncharacterized protein I206_106774 [Kwoniella pini CBS 10737]|uniref:Xylulose kinase n=1 Tax=Kwoniella pini CBS 10737 TaxID=1296096 RepID=A0AAJ8LAW8_9TREE
MSAPYFLGLDASTQSLKASLLSVNLDVVSECSIHFDSDLPHYGTKGGVIFGQDGEVYSPVLMIVEAMDKLFEKIKSRGWDVKEIRGVAAAGQFSNAFSRSIVPNWQDSSTTRECNALEDAVGGAKALAHITGSKAHERFTGAQIMRFRRIDSAGYEATDRISLVSSAITTLLCLDGEVKGIDESDVCGMNLWTMNKRERGWSQVLLEAIAGSEGAAELARKLGRVETDGGRPVGHVGSWYVQRYGFSPECLVFPGTGDNPATFLSLTYVVLVSTHKYHPHPDFHAFYHPAQIAPLSVQDTDKREGAEPLRYFNMLVYKTVEALRPVSKDDLPYQAAFWWLLPDIVPHGAHGVYKYVTDPSAGPFFEAATAKRVQDFSDPRKEAISILESQLLNYRSRSSSILDDQTDLSIPSTANIDISIPRLTRVYATGGASANRTILSMIADVLNTQVCKNVEYLDGKWQDAQWNSCSVGVAYKARWGWERTRNESRKWVGFDQVIKECRLARRKLRGGEGERSDLAEEGIRIIASPTEGARAFERRVEWWRELEKKALNDQRSQAV